MGMTHREARAALGCSDIPLECLFLNQDYVVINKVNHQREEFTAQQFVTVG